MFTVLHSSAGAGKTHALVKHYLMLCLKEQSPAMYRKVLALTFTNKAAGEMKERVIDYLDDLARNNVTSPQIADVMAGIVKETGLDAQKITERAERTLRHMLHHWSDVAITTIDSFTRKVVMPFTRDLQLDHDLRMTTEQDFYLDRAVQELIADAGVDPAVTELLSAACIQLLHDERRWDPEKPLSELSRELTKESSIAPLKALGAFPPEEVMALAGRSRAREVLFRRRVNALGNAALHLIESNNIDPADMAFGAKGIYLYYVRLARFSDIWEHAGPQKSKVVSSGKWTSGKADAHAIAAINSISDELTRIFYEAEALRKTEFRDYLIQRAVLRELMPAFALRAMDIKLEMLKREDGVAFFSDLTRKVSEVVKDEPVPFIYERMGERYEHFLIDEFQDTSLLQWQALLPLIDNALSTGGSTLLVGDAKQAIYRWRNGEVRLFAELPAIFGRGDDPVEIDREKTLVRNFEAGERLAFNRRSGSAIVQFNNHLFAPLSSILDNDLQKIYAQHEQESGKAEEGFVHVRVLPKETKSDEKRESFLNFTLTSIQHALADGFTAGDIAILVRSKTVGMPVAQHLVAHGFSVISPDGLKLRTDTSVGLLIDLLRYIHSGDPGAAARCIQYQAMLAAKTEDEFATLDVVPDQLPDPVKALRQWMSEHGSPTLKTTLSDLITKLARANNIAPAEDAPVLGLINEARAFSSDHGQDIGGFLEYWERSGDQKSVAPPESGNAIQVLTIHKAKGLQFPVVIVPDANMTSGGYRAELFWIDPGTAVPDISVALVRNLAAIKQAELPELEEERRLEQLDALNLLYVAFTRPEQRLYVLVAENGANDVTKALLDFIAANGQDGILQLGERAKPWKTKTTEEQKNLIDVAGEADNARLVMRLEAPDTWDPNDPDPYRSYGNAIHAIIERMNTVEDLPGAIQESLADGAITAETAERLSTELAQLLGSEELSPWFGKGIRVKNEATIITTEGKALRPDRVVFDKDQVRILDVKTGGASQHHHDQVRGYMHHLQELGHTNVKGALLYVRNGKIEPVEA